MGPDGGNAQTYLPEFFDTLKARKRQSLLAAFSYHTYGTGGAATNSGTGKDGLRNATVLREFYGAAYWRKVLSPQFSWLNQPSSQIQVWVGESASHAGGGTPSVSNRFGSLYYYMSTLAATAAANHSGFLRQDLVGASYGLVEGCATRKWEQYNLKVSRSKTPLGTCRPNPDYWGALLFSKLMGPRVMKVSVHSKWEAVPLEQQWHSGPDDMVEQLLAFGHCAANTTDLTLLLLNLANATMKIDVTSAALGATSRTEYVMTPGASRFVTESPKDILKTDAVLLNGKPLEMVGDVVPPLHGVQVPGGFAEFNIPPLAVAFVVVGPTAICTRTEDRGVLGA